MIYTIKTQQQLIEEQNRFIRFIFQNNIGIKFQ